MTAASSLQQKLMRVILTTSIAVLLLTCIAFFAYEIVTFRQTTVRELRTLGQIIGSNSTASLAFDDQDAAFEILSALKAEQHIVAAGLYDEHGVLFSKYPNSATDNDFPKTVEQQGYKFEGSYLYGYEPVIQNERRLGTVYLKSDMGALYERLRLYGTISAIVILLSLVLAYLLSKNLQRRISKPILALAAAARAVSDRQDYTTRAVKVDDDEVGLLTDAFNHMLTRIQEQTFALSESSARVHAVINSALSAVIVMDNQGLITDWNTRAEKMFGWSRQEAMGSELASLIIPEHLREAHRAGLARFLSTGEGRVIDTLAEMTALRRDRSEFPIEISISTLRAGNSLSFCGFVTDITDRKRAEEEILSFNHKLEQMVKERTHELEVANKELESFSYSVSHDLRAPLRSIHGYMTILAEDYGDRFDNEARRLVDIILKNGQKMGLLIDDLLSFSRLGRKELVRSNFSMQEMVEQVIDEQKRLSEIKNIEFILAKLPEANGDISTVRQIWVNLISNAIKYSVHQKNPVIEIGSFKKGLETVYFIKDNGAGFDMKYYGKLFGVFQRLHGENEFEGTGVGLAIVHRIISKHGGRIWADAGLNKGATFFFTLGS